MKPSFVFATLLAAVSSALAGVVSTTIIDSIDPAKWISVESGEIDHNALGTVANSTGVSLEARGGTPVVHCYNFGTSTSRTILVTVIDDFCNNRLIGLTARPGVEYWSRYNYGPVTTYVSLTMTGCSPWVVDSACNINLRRPVDGCNTGGVNGKQGGWMTDDCASWRTDPGSNGSDV
ncbi:hypothetical protein JR316_0010234 [Psilocybe cubensis]|uniref:Uncharacterized protein n=2 Tax=Psilocybe cubensis TaxID=181762 RepID=A0A8H7XSD9_PSICU|nr:hypothetical protein JR316_0010234 [Psilocybe cubensis]KAH9478001.1 hypothetical protein JR316_0010234 [Psilocybe cubensis]